MIRRTLSPRPDTRIVRLPHVVGQARLVGVPDLSRCCIWDTFTDADGTLLSDHKPDVGGPWAVQDLWTYYGSGSARAPIITANRALALGGEEGGSWAAARADCGPDVRIEASWLVYGVLLDIAAVMLWWSGEVKPGGRGGRDGISLVIYEYGGLYCYVRYPSVANPLIMQETDAVPLLHGQGAYRMRLEMRGSVAHWEVIGTGWSTKGAVATGAVPRPGVGWLSDGLQYAGMSYAARIDEFRACPL